MKIKIGSKIMLSYLIVLITTFLLSLAFSNKLLQTYIQSEIKEDLKMQADYIESQVKQIEGNTQILERLIYPAADKLVNSEFFIVSEDNRLTYNSNENINDAKNLLRTIRDIRNNDEYLSIVRDIANEKNSIDGKLVVYAKATEIDKLQGVLRNQFMQSFLRSSVIVLIIAFFIQRSITKPIKSLKKDMDQFSFEKAEEIKPIKTGDEIEGLYHGFINMIERLRTSDEERKRFFQNASHELKTPLMSIQGYAEAIKDGIVEGEEAEESLDIIINQSQKLKNLVEQVIYLTKLENLDIQYIFEMDSVVRCIENTMTTLMPIAEDKGIKLKFNNKISEDALINIDMEKMQDALINIVGNAFRYANKIIIIELSKKNCSYVLKIKDDGPGFAEGEEKKVFERFYKGNNGNSGIGLAIVQNIISAHDGKVVAYNNIPKGAIFEITLNAEKSE